MKYSEIRVRIRWFVILLVVLLPTLIFNFSTLRVTGLESGALFGDLRLVLNWADCNKESGELLYKAFDPNYPCSGYIYGQPLIFALNVLGIHVSMTKVIGYIFCSTIVYILTYSVNLNRTSKLTLVLVVLSPPFALLLDRANFDTLIAFLVLLSAIAFSKKLELTAIGCLVVATLFKFYTLPILFIALALCKSVPKKILIAVTTLVIGFYVALNIQKIQSPFPNGYYAKFGFSIWGSYAEKYSSHWSSSGLQLLINLFVSALLAIFLFKVRKYRQASTWDLELNSQYQIVAIWFLAAHVSCFVAGLSYDYRLVFIAISTLAYLSDSKIQTNGHERIVLSSLLCISLWFTFLVPEVAPIGDIALEVLTGWMLIQTSSSIFRNSRKIIA
jgi:hypothetical protein